MEQQELQFYEELNPEELEFTKVPITVWEWKVQIGNQLYNVDAILKRLDWYFDRMSEYFTTLTHKSSREDEITLLFKRYGLLTEGDAPEGCYRMEKKKMENFCNLLHRYYEQAVIHDKKLYGTDNE